MADLESQKTIENQAVNDVIKILGEMTEAQEAKCRKEILEIASRFHQPHFGPEILEMRKVLVPFCKKLRELADIVEGLNGYTAFTGCCRQTIRNDLARRC